MMIKIIYRLMELVPPKQSQSRQSLFVLELVDTGVGDGDTIPIVKPLRVSLAEEKVSPLLFRVWVGGDTHYQQVHIFTHEPLKNRKYTNFCRNPFTPAATDG